MVIGCRDPVNVDLSIDPGALNEQLRARRSNWRQLEDDVSVVRRRLSSVTSAVDSIHRKGPSGPASLPKMPASDVVTGRSTASPRALRSSSPSR